MNYHIRIKGGPDLGVHKGSSAHEALEACYLEQAERLGESAAELFAGVLEVIELGTCGHRARKRPLAARKA